MGFDGDAAVRVLGDGARHPASGPRQLFDARLGDDVTSCLLDLRRGLPNVPDYVDAVAAAEQNVLRRLHVDAATAQPGEELGIGVDDDAVKARVAVIVVGELLGRCRGPKISAGQNGRPADGWRLFDDDHLRARFGGAPAAVMPAMPPPITRRSQLRASVVFDMSGTRFAFRSLHGTCAAILAGRHGLSHEF